MNDILHLLQTSEMAHNILFKLDKYLFIFYEIAVGYLLIFALSSVFRNKSSYPQARKKFRYAVIFHSASPHTVIIESIQSFFKQEYPSTHYDVIAVSNSKFTELNEQLSELPIRLITAPEENYNKANAIHHVMDQLEDGAYDVAIIMDADSTAAENFLTKINDAYYSGGMAIQTHRMGRNSESDMALFGTISEEINNSIFRQGHVNLGFSSALNGSGMSFNFNWLKQNIVNASHIDLEKQLEKKLLEQNIFIEYLSDAHVYDDKVVNTEAFNMQNTAWTSNRRQSIRMMIGKFPIQLFRGNYDYCEKLFQWILPSRTIILGTLAIITIIALIFSWTSSLKWLGLLLALIATFSIAIPNYLINARFVRAIRITPFIFILTAINSIRRKK